MIESLNIENLALMKSANLELKANLLAITGQTGAGKSVLLKAISILCGSKSDKTLISKGALFCKVSASVYIENIDDINDFLAKNEITLCEENKLILSRTIKEKSSSCYINGQICPLGKLRELAELWIDFQGANEPQKLTKNAVQLELLDGFAKTDLSKYEQIYNEYLSLNNQINQLKNQEKLSPDEIDFLKIKLDEINSLSISKENIESLESDFKKINSLQELKESSSKICQLISYSDNSILNNLFTAQKKAEPLTQINDEYAQLHSRIISSSIELEDISSSYKELLNDLDFDEQKCQEISSKMSLWLSISRRYGNSVEEVLRKKEQMQNKIFSQNNVDTLLNELENSLKQTLENLKKQALIINENRLKAGFAFSKKIVSNLIKLGFKNPEFKVDFTACDFTKSGNCTCEYMFKPNTGQDFLPLKKIASSGETARVMLSIKNVISALDCTPVLIFDEVDANIGGEIGNSVGAMLKELANNRQILCITHLPQVASFASSHILVEKFENIDSTSVKIKFLEDFPIQERILELSRMLGDKNSISAQKHAKELLEKK